MAKEYIEREALLTVVKAVFHGTDPNGEEQHDVLKLHQIVREAPASDVVEVVRCKNCKHYKAYSRQCEHPDGLYLTVAAEDGYCSYGERRDA